LLQFFGVASPEAWQKYYFDRQLKVAFRISLASSHAPYAIAAWLRHGEIQAQALQTPAFQADRLKQVVAHAQKLAKDQPSDFFEQLQDLCLHAGVVLLHTPCLPKAPINGASRWVRDRPLIQLSDRHKRNDIFWFTFFHELGHILLHGKKYISLEEVAYQGKNLQYEQEADIFAQKHLLTDQQFAEIKESLNWSEENILHFSESFQLHPAMILGRLQREGFLPHTALPHLFEKVELNQSSNL
jgi:Zn-dependent peptidase ImmA (M78 family)